MNSLLDLGPELLVAILETLEMVSIAVLCCAIFGLLLGSLLAVTSPQGIAAARSVHQAVAGFVNISRSIPFLILIVLLLPLTRLLVGTSIGTAAAIVPLVIGGTPYAARLVEAAVLDVDPGLFKL